MLDRREKSRRDMNYGLTPNMLLLSIRPGLASFTRSPIPVSERQQNHAQSLTSRMILMVESLVDLSSSETENAS